MRSVATNALCKTWLVVLCWIVIFYKNRIWNLQYSCLPAWEGRVVHSLAEPNVRQKQSLVAALHEPHQNCHVSAIVSADPPMVKLSTTIPIDCWVRPQTTLHLYYSLFKDVHCLRDMDQQGQSGMEDIDNTATTCIIHDKGNAVQS